jgi:hypothetical protein
MRRDKPQGFGHGRVCPPLVVSRRHTVLVAAHGHGGLVPHRFHFTNRLSGSQRMKTMVKRVLSPGAVIARARIALVVQLFLRARKMASVIVLIGSRPSISVRRPDPA